MAPLDPDQDSMQNGGSFVSGAPKATLFVPKSADPACEHKGSGVEQGSGVELALLFPEQ